MAFERGEGFYLGAVTINYAIVLFLLIPVVILWWLGILSGFWTFACGLLGAVILPIVLYRCTKSWWLMIYFATLPHELPENQSEAIPVDSE